MCARPSRMHPYIQVSFPGGTRDPSLEAAVHRWVARLESDIEDALQVDVMIERVGRRGTTVGLTLSGGVDGPRKAATSHKDAYVAVSDAFRALRQQLLYR
jgi:ribosome-associated translation inhibitor RaiA